MPMWCPPTPPHDVCDVYIDRHPLYKHEAIPESQLPPVYVPPKHPKKPSPVSIISKASFERPGDIQVDTSETDETTSKKSPSKVARRDEPIFAPRSLFDKPSPALAKMRRDYRLQKYSCRPTTPSAIKNMLGPGAVTFPIIPAANAKPPPPPPADMPDWMVAEDHALLQTVQNLLELPLSLLVVNLAQTPNWELASEIVNMNSRTYRTPKHSKWRYENIVGPREEGKLLYDSPILSPTSPTKKTKKAKTFIKITPPSPSKAARYLKTSQLVAQDNNAQLSNFYLQKFDTMKSISNKRAPTSKPVGITSSSMKSNKQATIFAEHGINYDCPIPASTVAQLRIERLHIERKKLMQQQQALSAHSSSTQQTPTIGTILAATSNNAISTTASALAIEPATKVARTSSFPSVSTASGLVPLVLGTTTGEVIARANLSTGGNTLTAAQKRQSNLATQQQQQYLLQQKLQQQQQQQSQIQQALAAPIQAQQIVVSQSATGLQVGKNVLTSHVQLPGQILRATSQNMQRPPTYQVIVSQPSLTSQTLTTPTPMQTQQIVVTQPTGNLQLAKAVIASASQVPGQILRASSPSIRQAQPHPVLVSQTQSPLGQSSLTTSIQTHHTVTTSTGLQLGKNVIASPVAGQILRAAPQTIQRPLTHQVSLSQSPHGQSGLGGPIQSQLIATQSNLQVAKGLVGSQHTQIVRTPTSIQQPQTHQLVLSQQQPSTQQGLSNPMQTHQVVVSQPTASLQVAKNVMASQQVQGQLLRTQQNVQQPQTVVLALGLAQALGGTVGVPTGGVSTSTGNTGLSIGSAVVTGTSASGIAKNVTAISQQQLQRGSLQLVKQQTIGGKTVTRPVSEAEMAVLLKHHGLSPQTRLAVATNASPSTVSMTPTSAKTQVTTLPMSAATHTLLTSVGIQNIVKVQPPSASGQQITTLVKTPVSQSGSQGNTITFPLQLSQVKTVNKINATIPKQAAATVQQIPQLSPIQQQILLQRHKGQGPGQQQSQMQDSSILNQKK